MKLVKKIGYILAALIIPLIITLISYIISQKELKYLIYIILILTYLILELLLDLVIKYDFRAKKSTHVPYILLEYAACFSYVFGSLSLDIIMGWITSFLFWMLLILRETGTTTKMGIQNINSRKCRNSEMTGTLVTTWYILAPESPTIWM